jgi:hypothetical protein
MPNVVRIPVAAGAFDPSDITIDDNTSGAFLIKEGSNEYMRINTTDTQEKTIFKTQSGANTGFFVNAPAVGDVLSIVRGGSPATRTTLNAGTTLFQVDSNQILNDLISDAKTFKVDGTSVSPLVITGDSNATFTLADTSGAVFKIVDDDASPRTYFTATENGVVQVDGVKVGLGGGAIVDNVAIGDGAFEATQTSFGNSVAVGWNAGKRQTSAYNSTFVGFNAGHGVTTGINNTALGNASMDGSSGALSLTGTGNTGVGRASVRFCTTGSDNSGFGHEALENVSSGSDNVGLGALAGDSITTGSGNIAIGHDSDCAAAGTNQIAIGNGVVESTNNRASIGDSSNVATLDFSSSGNSWSTTSDVRIKENIQDSDLGLAFINSLRPVKHTSKNPAQWPEEIRPAEPSGRTPEQIEAVKDGLIAQEVKAAADALGTSFSGWEQDANGLNRLQYERFVVPLIKAVQELSAQVEELKGDK